MPEPSKGGMRPGAFFAWIAAIVFIAVVQSVVHLVVVLGELDLHSLFDLDRSNGAPDLVSTLALGAATIGAAGVASHEHGVGRATCWGLAIVLAALTVSDVLHEGAHPASPSGKLVVALIVAVGVLLAAVGLRSSRRSQATLFAGGCLLGASFLASGLDRFDPWFERRRGDIVAEYRIVAKEGFELLGWSLVAVALWDEALRRAAPASTVTARASRAPAASRRRGA